MSTASREGYCVDIQVGETLQLDVIARTVDSERICITLESKSGQKARLRIKADDSVSIAKTGARRLAVA